MTKILIRRETNNNDVEVWLQQASAGVLLKAVADGEEYTILELTDKGNIELYSNLSSPNILTDSKGFVKVNR